LWQSFSTKNTVAGKITLKGDPVTGTVVFVGPDGKEASGPINMDGTYIVANPSAGNNKIMVKGMEGPIGGAAPPSGGAPPPGVPKIDMPSAAKMGVPPPAKYATADNGLTFNVTTGAQKHDIELTP